MLINRKFRFGRGAGTGEDGGQRSAGFNGDGVLGCGALVVFGLSQKGNEDVFIKTSLSHHKHLSLLFSASLSFSHPLLEINKLIKKREGKAMTSVGPLKL